MPDGLRRPDGSSRFRPRNSELFTTAALIDAEERLLAAGRATDGPAIDQELAAAVTAREVPGRDHPLSHEQAAAVGQVLGSGRVLDVLVGPAGTGKSTAMAGVRAGWEARFAPGSVVGLAPSAAAAEVLAEAVGVPTENTTKWLTEAWRSHGCAGPTRHRAGQSLRTHRGGSVRAVHRVASDRLPSAEDAGGRAVHDAREHDRRLGDAHGRRDRAQSHAQLRQRSSGPRRGDER